MINRRPAKSPRLTRPPWWSVRVKSGAVWLTSRRGMWSSTAAGQASVGNQSALWSLQNLRRLEGVPLMSEQTNKSVGEIEADIAVTRARLASTIDELAVRAQPKEIARRQADSAMVKLNEATHTPTGELRIERIVAMVAAVVALVGLVVWRRTRDCLRAGRAAADPDAARPRPGLARGRD